MHAGTLMIEAKKFNIVGSSYQSLTCLLEKISKNMSHLSKTYLNALLCPLPNVPVRENDQSAANVL